ncbi:MAG: RluA family pseudouridine synthase [Deltaproteobacteria bacterium]|nr:MAG: RluA family pseudouridine synthase [Deltaproteobacteria bacterium]
MRCDLFLLGRNVLETRSQIKRRFTEGDVRVNGKGVKAGHLLREGDVVVLTIPPPQPCRPEPEAIPLSIVYEDPCLVVIDKPAGLVVHPAAGHWQGTLVNALLHHFRGKLPVIGGAFRPGIVHRLDKDTSGLLVVARNDAAHHHLAAQFKSRRAGRTYLAFAWGAFPTDTGVVEAAIGRHPIDRKRMAVRREGGKRAVTHWEVVARYPGITKLSLKLETGRTHQIRVHLAHLGHPLVGDPVYGRSAHRRSEILPPSLRAVVLRLGRQALHAWRLSFLHPETEREMVFTAPLPPDLVELEAALEGAAPPPP